MPFFIDRRIVLLQYPACILTVLTGFSAAEKTLCSFGRADLKIPDNFECRKTPVFIRVFAHHRRTHFKSVSLDSRVRMIMR